MHMSFGTPKSFNANVIPTCPFQFLFSSITLPKKLFSDFLCPIGRSRIHFLQRRHLYYVSILEEEVQVG